MYLQAAVMLLKNGVMIATIWAESIPYWASASNTAIVNMIPGDQVRINSKDNQSLYLSTGPLSETGNNVALA